MENPSLATAAAAAAQLEGLLGTRQAYEEARTRYADALRRKDDVAMDHWGAVSLLVVDAWRACPSGNA